MNTMYTWFVTNMTTKTEKIKSLLKMVLIIQAENKNKADLSPIHTNKNLKNKNKIKRVGLNTKSTP